MKLIKFEHFLLLYVPSTNKQTAGQHTIFLFIEFNLLFWKESFLLIQSHMSKWNELELNCVLSMLLTKIFWLFTLVWDSVHFGKYNIEKFHNISFIRIGFCVLFIVIVLCYIISLGDFLLLFQWNHIMEQYWPEITENLSKPFLWVDSFKAF